MGNRLTGACLCGEVSYSVATDFDAFYFCHCEQCQKVTGSAFAANIITSIDNIEWHTGQSQVINYDHPNRAFSKAFCSKCGSGLPHTNKSRTSLVIPAGSLDQQPAISPTANLFDPESPAWLAAGLSAQKFKRYPE